MQNTRYKHRDGNHKLTLNKSTNLSQPLSSDNSTVAPNLFKSALMFLDRVINFILRTDEFRPKETDAFIF